MLKFPIHALLARLKENAIIREIKSGSIFYDEPKLFYFTADINKNLPLLKEIPYELTAGGISALSPQKALLKCLMECVERYSLFASTELYRIDSYDALRSEALNPSLYTHSAKSQANKLSWTEGYDISKSMKSFIPAQLINLNHKRFEKEELLTTVMSTGAASGFTHERTLLGGIYEIVERDAFMTMYLNKIKVPRLDISRLKDKEVQYILEVYRRYKLEVYVFDMTNDLGIPVILSILIDRTGKGPAITLGAKSSLDIKDAILGSLEESFMARPWIRFEMLKNTANIPLNPSTNRLDRALLWSSQKSIKKLDFLILQDTQELSLKGRAEKLSDKAELSLVCKKIFSKGFSIYYKDITANEFLSASCKVYKAVIPGLQPLYLYKPEHLLKRLTMVSEYFKQKKVTINPFPHPFL